MQPDIQAFFDEHTFTITYLVSDPATRQAVIIDPVLDFDPKAARTSTQSAQRVLDAVRAKGLTVEWILETHAHADHLSAAVFLKEHTGAKVAVGAHIKDVQKVFRPIFDASDVRGDGAPFDRLYGHRGHVHAWTHTRLCELQDRGQCIRGRHALHAGLRHCPS